jgi:copper homeostasis protein
VSVPTANAERVTMPLLEVIVNTVDDAKAAEAGGAHRLEVVSRLDQDGLTPPRDIVVAMLDAVQIPLRVMVRPSDTFVAADASARAAILADATALADLPIDGVVTGYLDVEGAVDTALLADIAAAAGHPVTFHRAIERVRAGDPVAALRSVPSVDRVLTGGGDGDWVTRVRALEALQVAVEPVTVIAGGGLNAEGLSQLAAARGLREFHVGRSARRDARVDGPVEAAAVRRIGRILARAESG